MPRIPCAQKNVGGTLLAICLVIARNVPLAAVKSLVERSNATDRAMGTRVYNLRGIMSKSSETGA
jgi:hypothetical protein